MDNREKVIKGLRCIAGDVVWCAHCPYSDVNGSGRGDRCKRDCAKDALALLKAQEPVKPLDENYWKHTMGRCGHCKAPLPAIEGLRSKFCWMCGKAVKWDD